ncbi:MAG: hypothetical protein WD468_06590 [Pirellulales bacterium]
MTLSDSETRFTAPVALPCGLRLNHERAVELESRRTWPARIAAPFRAIGAAAEWIFGLASLVLLLAFLASIPVLNLLSLGYLLEAGGRVARTGRVRDGFIGIRKAARIGGIVLGTWLLLWPLRMVSGLWKSAWLIDPESNATSQLHLTLVVLTAVLVPHILWAWWRGGRLRHFLWPAPVLFFKRMLRGGKLREARDGLWDFVCGLRLPYYFWLGLRGFVGTVVWLVVPVTLLAMASRLAGPLPAIVGLIGGVMLAVVLLYLPFLQMHFAATGRLRAFRELGAVRRAFRGAPIAFWIALLATLSFALPLYLLKIELVPRQVTWLPAVVFVLFILPAKLLAGWAYGRGARRERPRHWIFRVTARLGMIPLVAAYVFLTYFTQYLLWHGVWSLYEQHAFLVPAPF